MIATLFDAVGGWLLLAAVFILGAKLLRYIARRIFWDK